MPLTSEDRAKFDKCDPQSVAMKLTESGARGTQVVAIFENGPPHRACDIEAFLHEKHNEKHAEETTAQRKTLNWKRADFIAGVVIGATTIVVMIWLARLGQAADVSAFLRL
jgi:hypothetical protein